MTHDKANYKKYMKDLKQLGKTKIQVGTVGDHAGEISNGDLMTIHEFGTKYIPARAPFRNTFRDDKNMKYIQTQTLHAMNKHTSEKGINVLKVAQMVGMVLAALVKKTIMNRLSPALSPDYAARKKGSDIPLYLTGELRDSIDYGIKS